MRGQKKKLRELRVLQSLPYLDIQEAHRIIDKGADTQLLFFWLNLKRDRYHPFFDLKSVIRQATYFAENFPDLQQDIIKWVTKYTEMRGKKHIHELVQKLQNVLSNENQQQQQQPDNGNLL